MPEDFERCVRNGGRVRTKKLPNGKYIKLCFLNGKSYSGEVHTKETIKKKSKKSKK